MSSWRWDQEQRERLAWELFSSSLTASPAEVFKAVSDFEAEARASQSRLSLDDRLRIMEEKLGGQKLPTPP